MLHWRLVFWGKEAGPLFDKRELAELARHRVLEIIRYAQNDPEDEAPLGDLRTLLDEWAAFVGGGKLLRRGRQGPTQRWFNNPCPVADAPILLEKVDWASREAEQIVSDARREPQRYKKANDREGLYRLMLDHSVPIATIRAIITDTRSLWQPDRMISFLKRNFKRGLITRKEDESLTAARLGDRMPWRWDDGDDPLIRYELVGIVGKEIATN